MSAKYVHSTVLDARDTHMNTAKSLVLGAYSLTGETKLIMNNFSKMWSTLVEVSRITLRTF